MSNQGIGDKLREYFRQTSTNELKLPSGHNVFMVVDGKIWVRKDGGSIELSLVDAATQAAIRAALPVDIRDIQEYKDLSLDTPLTPDEITKTKAYKDLCE